MQKKLKYILKKKLTVKGVPLDAEKIKTVEHFFSSLHNVSVVFRCVGSDYLSNQYNTSKDNIALLSEYVFFLTTAFFDFPTTASLLTDVSFHTIFMIASK